MESLKLKHEAMQKALTTLQEVLESVNVLTQCGVVLNVIRDSIIKRFEYCIDSFWKFLKIYLEEVQKIDVKLASPREVLRLSLQDNVITKAEYEILIYAVTDRNLTSHTYNEDLANKISSQVPLYFATMKTIVNRLKINQSKQ
ncbi:MAG: HI0074 family nucleotidyltransferase substrate-binding subunit [Candidatus Babeliales bacterium]|jgi:nucleotidyltransferase substrate binding protein (TIGR01987 family)